ncbi:MAG TPA: cupin domain-containing protein [Aggregatilineales bacterium]|nr:cupin domain-containing protein [Aggregatilineales bacterium]
MSEMMEEHVEWVNMGEGVRRRIVSDGAALMVVEVELAPGAVVPIHHHMNEQATYIVRGRLRYTIGDRTTEYHAGQGVSVASNVPHGVVATEETLVIDSFNPPREDFRVQRK